MDPEKRLNICEFGKQHPGIVIAACLAEIGHNVIGLDFDSEVIRKLERGDAAQLREPGLNRLICDNIEKGTLLFTTSPSQGLKEADILWVAFDTSINSDGNAMPKDIQNAFMLMLYASIFPDSLKVIISSQVPVGFTREMHNTFREKYPNITLPIAYSPENLRIGKAIETFMQPGRIVIGTNPGWQHLFIPFFSSICKNLVLMSIESAEMTKHAINSFLATSICFINEIAELCEVVGADPEEVERGLKSEGRIGCKEYLTPGGPFEGKTLARDVKYLQRIGLDHSTQVPLINTILCSNEMHREREKI